MKKLIALLLLPFMVGAQTITVPLPAGIVYEQRLNAKIDSLAKALSGTVAPPITKPACTEGPEIRDIRDIQSNSLVLQFHGDGVDTLQFEIWKSSHSKAASGLIVPKSAVVQVTYPVQADGTYQIVIRGYSCKSKDSDRYFEVKTSSGGAVTPPPVQPGTYQAEVLTKGMDEHMKLSWKNTAEGRLFTDEAKIDVQDGKEYRYVIGSQIIRQSTPLKDYLVAGNNPFRILKAITKKSASSLTYWGRESWQDLDLGQSFSFNNSTTFYTFVSRGPQDANGFLNHIPQSFDAQKQLIQWTDIAPDMKLPAGHAWITVPEYPDYMKVIRKGGTHLPHHFLPWKQDGSRETVVEELKYAGLTYNNVPRLEHMMGLSRLPGPSVYNPANYDEKWWPNGPFNEEQARQKGNQTDVSDAIFIGETEESPAHMPAEQQMWYYYWDTVRNRYEQTFGARGIPFLICHNYYIFWENMPNTRAAAKAKLSMSPEQLPRTNYSPGGTLSRTNLIVDAVYLGAPDIQQDQIYQSIYKMVLWENMGYKAGLFLFGVHEWNPNNFYEYIYPEGRFYQQDKVPLDPSVHIANGFLAQVYGNLFAEWGGKGKSGNKYFGYGTPGTWFDHGSNLSREGFPFKDRGDGFWGYSGSVDLSYFSQKLFNDTFGQTEGGERKYLRHRIDGGPWVNPSQVSAEEVVDAQYDKRGFVLSQSKNGKTAWFYINIYADNKFHTLDVELPGGKIESYKVAGIGIHAKIQNS